MAPNRVSFGSIALAAWLVAGTAQAQTAAAAIPPAAPVFPRLMGMNIGSKHYEQPLYQSQLARLDLVILDFYRGWGPRGYGRDSTDAMRRVARTLKTMNPQLLLGQYTLLSEASDDANDAATGDLRGTLGGNGWWLTNAAGRRLQWTTAYGAWEVNFTQWTPPDASGRRWPEWLAERNHAVFFRDIPEFDIVYLDNVMAVPRVSGDWDRDGHDDDPHSPAITNAYRAGHRAHWDHIRTLQPHALLMGNTDNDLSDPQWAGQLDGAFLEAMMGKPWSIERREGWTAMMTRYRAAIANTRPPRIVGFNVWGDPADRRFFRYAYGSCLLDDGYFSFTDRAASYSSVPWFPEYDFKLGRAISPPPAAAWSNSVWRRDFENGAVLVNPSAITRVVWIGPELEPFAGGDRGDLAKTPLGGSIALEPRDGIVLVRRTTGR